MASRLWPSAGTLMLVSALVMGLSACSGGSAPESASAPVSPSASSVSDSLSPSSSPSAATLPAGAQEVRAPQIGVSFAAPPRWKAIDRSLAGNSELLTEIARTSGQSEATLRTLLTQVEVFVAGPPSNGFAPNINVFGLAGGDMPSADQIRTEVGSIGTVSAIDEVPSTMGTVTVTTYTATLAGAKVAAQQIYAATSRGLAIITVTTNDAKQTATLASMVLASFRAI